MTYAMVETMYSQYSQLQQPQQPQSQMPSSGYLNNAVQTYASMPPSSVMNPYCQQNPQFQPPAQVHQNQPQLQNNVRMVSATQLIDKIGNETRSYDRVLSDVKNGLIGKAISDQFGNPTVNNDYISSMRVVDIKKNRTGSDHRLIIRCRDGKPLTICPFRFFPNPATGQLEPNIDASDCIDFTHYHVGKKSAIIQDSFSHIITGYEPQGANAFIGAVSSVDSILSEVVKKYYNDMVGGGFLPKVKPEVINDVRTSYMQSNGNFMYNGIIYTSPESRQRYLNMRYHRTRYGRNAEGEIGTDVFLEGILNNEIPKILSSDEQFSFEFSVFPVLSLDWISVRMVEIPNTENPAEPIKVANFTARAFFKPMIINRIISCYR